MRPRDYAVDLVTAWINREQPNLDAVPEWCRDLARSHARNTCQQVKFHGDRVLSGQPLESVPRGLINNVQKYVDVRRVSVYY